MLAAVTSATRPERLAQQRLKKTGPGLMVDKKELSVPIRCFVSPSRSWGATAVADVLNEAAPRQAPEPATKYGRIIIDTLENHCKRFFGVKTRGSAGSDAPWLLPCHRPSSYTGSSDSFGETRRAGELDGPETPA
jgi:hypothetical protein